MDIKLGTVLYDAFGSVTDNKRTRMIEVAKKTTSKEAGIRITGFQVCQYIRDRSQAKVIFALGS
jgi:1D-myo-inositol-tetrakisphosphate 5-kinase/inositol-polyphosphate multikinase